MARELAALANRANAVMASDMSSCGGGGAESLSSGFNSGDIVLGHGAALSHKRSLDNAENIPPPFDLDAAAAAAVHGGAGSRKQKPTLLGMAAQQMSQNKYRRTMALAGKSPRGSKRMPANPRRVAQKVDISFLRSAQQQAQQKQQQQQQPKYALPPPLGSFSSDNYPQAGGTLRSRIVHVVADNNNGSNIVIRTGSHTSNNVRLRRLPKRNLKPLDFSGLHRASNATSSQPSTAETASSTATGQVGNDGHMSLPVSPVESSPIAVSPLDPAGFRSSSPAYELFKGVGCNTGESMHPTPPSTGPRVPGTAFSGILASAYQRASSKRSAKRALNFDSSVAAEIGGLLDYDPVLGPRCPVIGDPRGIFSLQRNGLDQLHREQVERTESRFSDMARTVRKAQAAFEAAVSVQKTAGGRGRPASKRTAAKPSSCHDSSGAAAAKAPRPISECKYCGKQYKYHSKLASHEQHCSSRLEALLYSADENEQHIIHCVCGPRHDRPVGARDDLPMVQCDSCSLWLHIECVGIDEENLPDEFFCPRCEDDMGPRAAMLGRETTPEHQAGLGSEGGIMSPQSHRLATLLAGVPDDGSETEDEPIVQRMRGKRAAGRNSKVPTGRDASSEVTMSISDVSEATRFHRQGSAGKRSDLAGAAPRLAQSETGISPMATPARRNVRGRPRGSKAKGAGGSDNEQVVHTDVLSSDFLGLPLPESIYSLKPPQGTAGVGAPLSIAPELCSRQQQQQMDDISRFLSDPPPQWSLAQLSNMLSGADADSAAAADMIGSSAAADFVGQALVDMGLGALDAVSAALVSGVASSSLAASVSAAAGGDASQQAGPMSLTATPLSELVDLPMDNDFSALLESIASANPGGDGDPYSSLDGDAGFGGLFGDDVLLGLSNAPATGTAASVPLATSNARGGRTLVGASRAASGTRENEHGSSSTITIMHDDSSVLGSADAPKEAAGVAPQGRPPVARPPPGLAGATGTRKSTYGGTKAGNAASSRLSGDTAVGKPAAAAGNSRPQLDKLLSGSQDSLAMALSLPSNPPSGAGLTDLDVSQLLADSNATGALQQNQPLLDWQVGVDALEKELEGLIDFDI